LPVSQGRRFRTYKDDQRVVSIRIIEGGDASGRSSTPIGKCLIDDLPPGLPAGTVIEVYFKYMQNGRLKVRARLPSIGREVVMNIEREAGLSEERFEHWNQKLRNQSGPIQFISALDAE
jgi:molecular chaperone DnaK